MTTTGVFDRPLVYNPDGTISQKCFDVWAFWPPFEAVSSKPSSTNQKYFLWMFSVNRARQNLSSVHLWNWKLGMHFLPVSALLFLHFLSPLQGASDRLSDWVDVKLWGWILVFLSCWHHQISWVMFLENPTLGCWDTQLGSIPSSSATIRWQRRQFSTMHNLKWWM